MQKKELLTVHFCLRVFVSGSLSHGATVRRNIRAHNRAGCRTHAKARIGEVARASSQGFAKELYRNEQGVIVKKDWQGIGRAQSRG